MNEDRYVNKQDLYNVNSLWNMLAGLGVFATGAGLTLSGLKALKDRVAELPLSTVKQPSYFVQKNDKLKKVLLNSKYTTRPEVEDDTDDDASSYPYKSAAANIAAYRTCLTKKANEGIFEWLPWKADWGIEETGRKGAPKLVKWLTQQFTGADSRTVGRSGDVKISKDAPLKDRILGVLASRPGLRPAWFLPAATGAIGLGFVGGSKIADTFNDILGRSSMKTVYGDKAEKIYRQSVKYLQDVAAGKVKANSDTDEDADEAITKTSAFNTFQKIAKKQVTGDGTTGFFLNPSFLVGLVLAGLTARQIKGGIRGYDAAKREIADRTHLRHAFQAAEKERENQYNKLHLELDTEPVLTDTDKSLSNRSKRLMVPSERKNLDPLLRYENYQMEDIRSKRNRLW